MADPITSLSKDGRYYDLTQLHEVSKTENISFNNGVIRWINGQIVTDAEILSTDNETYLLIGNSGRSFALVLSDVPVITDIKATEIVAIAVSLGYGLEDLKSTEEAVFMPSPVSVQTEKDAKSLGKTLVEHNDDTGILSIPPEVLILVYSYLDLDSVLALCQVNRTFNELCKDWEIWKTQVMKECPEPRWIEGVTDEQNLDSRHWIQTLRTCVTEKRNRLGEELLQNWTNIDKVRELIAAGANLDTVDIKGYTTLSLASSRGLFEIAQLLIEAGANVNITGKTGVTALRMASIFGHSEIVERLIDAGANVNAADNEGFTALINATTNGHSEIVELLIEAGADVNAKNNNGDTALIWASKKGYSEIVELLIEAGADVNFADSYGYTALMIASRDGHSEIVERLIDAGADVNLVHITNKKGYTALMLASREGHSEIVKLLINAGADVNITNNGGDTALMWASRKRHSEIAQLLRTAGAIE